VPPLITLDAVTAVRPTGEVAVRKLSWTLADGQTWAITGPVGSGKTALAELLTGRHRVVSGSIAWPFLGGRWPGEAVRLVTFRQSSQLFSPERHYYQQRFNSVEPQDDLKLAEYLGADGGEVATVATRLGLDQLLPLSFIALSSGQMRRARIARALLSKPELLILDDPFLGLDTAGRSEVSALLGELVGQGTRLVLICPSDAVPRWVTNVVELQPQSGEEGQRRGLSPTSFQDTAGINSVAHLSAPVVELRNVTVRYGDRIALDHLSWTVRTGERWAVVGPNGSGKTTLLSLLCGDHPQAYANDIRLFDRRRGSGETIWDLKHAVGYVSSELHLYYSESLTAIQAAATGFHDVLAFRRPTPAQQADVEVIFDELDLAGLKDRRFDRLSTGEQRLVLLARALVKRPPLLILDEPFQGLDRATMHRVRDWLDRTVTQEQTLIVVTHEPDEIPRAVSRRLELDRGRDISNS
jgi:molybdate transport system ATP-binding protein